VMTNTLTVPVAQTGAVLPGVVMPWTNLPGTGVHSALPQNFCLVVVTTEAAFATPRTTAVMARQLAVKAAGLPIDIRKQYVHKTRVNAGGDGAAGPHPEREPA
jgi:hypothetical protein